MKLASLFHLAGPDLFVILIIVLLLFGAKERLRQRGGPLDEPRREGKEGLAATLNRLLVPIAIIVLLLAAWVWLSGH